MKKIAACVFILAAPSVLWAQTDQFVLLDTHYTHNTETRAFSFFPIPAGVPDNWYAPVDYVGGTIHMRLEVLSKPSTKGVNYQICIFQDQHSSDKHACAKYQYFTAPGVYTWQQPVSSLWQFNVIDWSRKLLDTMLVVKDKNGNPVDDRYGFGGAWDGSPDFSLYYPMEVHFTAIVVRNGGIFTGWGGSTTPPDPSIPPSDPPTTPGTVTESGYNEYGVFVGFPSGGGESSGEGKNGDDTLNDTACGGSVGACPPGFALVLALSAAFAAPWLLRRR